MRKQQPCQSDWDGDQVFGLGSSGWVGKISRPGAAGDRSLKYPLAFLFRKVERMWVNLEQLPAGKPTDLLRENDQFSFGGQNRKKKVIAYREGQQVLATS